MIRLGSSRLNGILQRLLYAYLPPPQIAAVVDDLNGSQYCSDACDLHGRVSDIGDQAH
jgi:hypothetical protein